jgi:ribosomal protein S18 acetylase RimI-like enzyme
LSVELRPTSTISLGEQTELFNRGYEGYLIPFSIDETTMRFMVEKYDLDREASRLAYDGDTPVGFGNLGLRGDDAWIGGVAVVPEARRSGIGETLMRALHDEAAARGARRVWLEVIDRNEGAFLLYEKLGYRTVRDLEVWSLPSSEEAGAAREVPAAEAHARIKEFWPEREPWQRADETLAHLDDLRGLVTDDGAAVFRVSGVVQPMQIAGNGAESLLRTLRSQGNVSVLNLPVDDAASAALRTLGGTVPVRQREMVLELPAQG